MSISAATGRSRPEMTPFDSLTQICIGGPYKLFAYFLTVRMYFCQVIDLPGKWAFGGLKAEITGDYGP
jgi:hypothetical protein